MSDTFSSTLLPGSARPSMPAPEIARDPPEHILVINRWHDDFARYDASIDHDRYRVAYITTPRGVQALVPELAEAIVTLDALDDGPAVTACAFALAARHGPFDRVIALSEFDLALAAQLRVALGAPGPRPDDVRLVRDKVAMKQRVHEAGIRAPRFAVADSPARVRAFARETGLPVVLKPRDGAASAGVVIARTSAQLDAALARLPLHRYQCEEYVTGDVYQVDGIVASGRLLAMRPGRCINSDLDFARGVRVGWILNDDPVLEERIRAFTIRVLDALGLRTGAFHLELFRAPAPDGGSWDELVFLEIGARVGGSQILYMWRDLYGVDLQDAWIRLQLGERVDLPALDASSAMGGFVLIPEPADVPCRVVARTSLIGTIPELYEELLPPVGAILDGHGGYDDIAGRFRFRGDSRVRVECAIRRAMREYRFEVAPCAAPSAPSAT